MADGMLVWRKDGWGLVATEQHFLWVPEGAVVPAPFP